LVLLENADRVIGHRIAKRRPDEKWLRDLLMNEDLFLFVATAPTFFEQVMNKDHPLYELFRIEVIDDLSFDESLELLVKYAEDEGRTDLVKEFKAKANRIQAIYTLIGGNPRLLIMLYILVQDSITNINNVEIGFFNLLEELTPYFQSRMAQLSDNEEKVLVAFAEGPEQLTPAEVGRKIRRPTNLVTANLKRLQSAGFIKRIEQPIKGRKGTLYRLSETIYRYWYQMNSERNREMAEVFVRFIVLFYTCREIKEIYGSQSERSSETQKASKTQGYVPKEVRYPEVAMDVSGQAETERLFTSLEKELKKKSPPDTIRNIYDELIEINPKDPLMLNKYAGFLYESGDFEGAIPLLREMAQLTEQTKNQELQWIAYYYWGNALSASAELKGDEELFRESFEKYASAVKYKKDMHEAYHNWGTALSKLAELKGDEELFRESFEKYGKAWSIIKKLTRFDQPMMMNTGLRTVIGAYIVGKDDEADHTFIELMGALSKVVDLKAIIPYFFTFFETLANKAKIAGARSYLEQLLSSRFKKELNALIPFRFLYEYLEHKDDAIIRRQPPEIQKVLNEMIKSMEKKA
jgi:DNA-binding MarR family transcriptional regulator